MTGKAGFLVMGITAILLASAILSWGFISYESEPVGGLPDNGLPLDGAGEYDSEQAGAAEPTMDDQRLEIGETDIPWENGLVVFVILSSSIMIVLFARLREEDVLEGVRKDIYEYISENPGEHLAEIQRQFGISSSSARHHLDVLEWSDRIVSHRSGKHKHFYPNRNGYRKYTSGFGYKEIMATLKNDPSRSMEVPHQQ